MKLYVAVYYTVQIHRGLDNSHLYTHTYIYVSTYGCVPEHTASLFLCCNSSPFVAEINAICWVRFELIGVVEWSCVKIAEETAKEISILSFSLRGWGDFGGVSSRIHCWWLTRWRLRARSKYHLFLYLCRFCTLLTVWRLEMSSFRLPTRIFFLARAFSLLLFLLLLSSSSFLRQERTSAIATPSMPFVYIGTY